MWPKLLLLLAAVTLSLSSKADVILPKIFSENMVIQRDTPVLIWGWADRGETIIVTFNNTTGKTKADNNGNWSVTLKPMAYGGPFEMRVKGKSKTITLKNILIGDVWIGSGQSNMEWIIKNTNHAKEEIANGNHPSIRLFTVKKATSFEPQKDFAGGEWLECNSQTLGDFSAVAYFFGRKINKDLNIPIGLINSSWGGTNIQTWMSWDVMSKKEEYKNLDITSMQASANDLKEKEIKYIDAIKNERGKNEKWYQSSVADWKKMKLPQHWEDTEIGNADGYVWFSREFELSADQAAEDLSLSLGPIDDQDETYVNGAFVGATNGWNKDRVYTVSSDHLKNGKNRIAVRVYDTGGGGGIYGKPELMFYEIAGERTPLAGQWSYKTSVLNTDFGIKATGPNAFPSQLYNAMIAPIIQFPIKGVIWYQGEANAGDAYRYRTLFPEMINDWRTKWKNEFPFFWVQLANFMEPDATPSQSEWAELREAQSMTKSLPKTGQAVIIDIGEAGDIHPRNKQDVGYRLALAALKVAYDKDVVYSGPVYNSMEKRGNKIVLTFSNVGSGLIVKDKYGYLKGFAIAGDDHKFVWAHAALEGDNVVVYSDEIKNPVAVRYAWGDNPEDANLYNQEGLPASPFRTDTWPGITEGKK